MEAFGSAGLTRKSQYELEERRLKEVGATLPKSQPIPRRVGRGMSKKQREREQKQREEARRLGVRPPKRNIPSDVQRGNRDAGLQWGASAGDKFKGGVLHVRSRQASRALVAPSEQKKRKK